MRAGCGPEVSVQLALVNGQACDSISIFDRGLQFGDGVFETAAVEAERPLLFGAHIQRLRDGCKQLDIRFDESALRQEVACACSGAARGVLKLIVTRGSSARGYAASPGAAPTRIVSVQPWPGFPEENARRGVAVGLCRLRLARQPRLAGLKHLNRLEQILARMEWRAEWQEGLLLDQDGRLIEATSSNVFLVREDAVVCTPDLAHCGVAGVIRAALLEHQRDHGVMIVECELTAADLAGAREIFLTNSLIGLWPVVRCDRRQYPVGPVARRLQEYMREQNWAIFA